MVSLDFFAIKAGEFLIPKTHTRPVLLIERLFFLWISALAAMVFLLALGLTLVQLISFMQLLYLYAGIMAVTLLLAGALYFARRNL